jgi:hypothetical protein
MGTGRMHQTEPNVQTKKKPNVQFLHPYLFVFLHVSLLFMLLLNVSDMSGIPSKFNLMINNDFEASWFKFYHTVPFHANLGL